MSFNSTASFNLSDFIDLDIDETQVKQEEEITIPDSPKKQPKQSAPATLNDPSSSASTDDPTLALWDMFPLYQENEAEEPYSDPFENSALNTKQSLPFRTLMLEHKHNFDSLFKSLQTSASQPVTVNYCIVDYLNLDEMKAALDLCNQL